MNVLAGTATALALLCGAAVLVTVRCWRTALRVLLDLLAAAGMLRLAADPGWGGLATAAAVILLRHLLWSGLAAPVPASGKAAPVPPVGAGWR
ncbi:hypothetical protein [Micromonospora sp. KC723]|uniref:hypothetical protein n=1 Tax=Micromonospora sp. KC723 TaxID=2530381 RepID=UPI0010497784|nr:hypothetical protein [Micromonospora sp. KC723]TDB71432.1 hypothetical protein E1165_23075 [Micromonospora sp. KC723]